MTIVLSEEAQSVIVQEKRARGREAREPAGGRPGGEGGNERAPRGGTPGTLAEVPKKLKSLKTLCFSKFYENWGVEKQPISEQIFCIKSGMNRTPFRESCPRCDFIEKVFKTSSRGSSQIYPVPAPWQAFLTTGVEFSHRQGPRSKPESVCFRALVQSTPQTPKSTFCTFHFEVKSALIFGSKNTT